jgi:hypothetical protein
LNSHAPDLRTAHPDRGGLKTSLILSRCELRKLERADAEAEQVAVQKVLHVLNRAEALSGNPHMDTGDAIAFLAELAESGDQEAKELLASLNDPFLGAE